MCCVSVLEMDGNRRAYDGKSPENRNTGYSFKRWMRVESSLLRANRICVFFERLQFDSLRSIR